MNPLPMVRREMDAALRGAGRALGGTLFGGGVVCAAGCLVALALAPRFAMCAVLGMTTAWAGLRVCGFDRDRIEAGDWLRGALLTSLALGWASAYWQWTVVKWTGGAAAAGLAGAWVSVAAEWCFTRVLGLPVLSAGFVVAGSMVWGVLGGEILANPQVLPAVVQVAEPGWLPELPAAFLRSLSAVFFLPHAVAGGILLLVIAWRSPLAVVAAAAGWCGGLLADAGLRFLAPWLPPAGNLLYNATLCGLAVSACFFVPSPRAWLLSAVTGALATGICHAIGSSVAPGSPLHLFPLPFLLATWTVLAALRLRRGTAGVIPAADPSARPEESLSQLHEQRLRHPHAGLPALHPPFPGERRVTQGEDGPHTHRGPWRHALDFEIRDAAGAAAPPGSTVVEECYTFRSPVLSPVSGWVLRVEDEIEDNPLGHHNLEHNWGNSVLLRTECGVHVLLSHFLRRGIAVSAGQYVTVGTFLGSCGNSGRSPVPHLHLHCQESARSGSPTVPFRLAHWVEHLAGERIWHACGLPAADTRLTAFEPDPWASRLFQSWRAGAARFRVEAPGAAPRLVTLEIRFTEDGRWNFLVPEERAECFGTIESGTLCLRGCHAVRAGLLSWLALACARVPFTRDLGMRWSEQLPSPHPRRGPRALLPAPATTVDARVTALRGDASRLDSLTLAATWRDANRSGTILLECAAFLGPITLEVHTPEGPWLMTRLESLPHPNS